MTLLICCVRLHLSSNSYSFMAHHSDVEQLAGQDGVLWIGHYKPMYKYTTLSVPQPDQMLNRQLSFDILLSNSLAAQQLDRFAACDHLNDWFQQEGLSAKALPTTTRQWTMLVEVTVSFSLSLSSCMTRMLDM